MTDQGQLSPLAIGVVFAVVIAMMNLGVQGWEQDTLEYEPPTDLEQRLRDAIWEEVDDERAERNRTAAIRGSSPRGTAQTTARELTTRAYFDAPTAIGLQSGEAALPNAKGFCDRVPAKLTVNASGWGDRSVSNETIHAVGDRVVDLFGTHTEQPIILRSNEFSHGMGVAVDGEQIYVVYRTCNLGY